MVDILDETNLQEEITVVTRRGEEKISIRIDPDDGENKIEASGEDHLISEPSCDLNSQRSDAGGKNTRKRQAPPSRARAVQRSLGVERTNIRVWQQIVFFGTRWASIFQKTRLEGSGDGSERGTAPRTRILGRF